MAGTAIAAATPSPPALELVGIDKRFGAVHANRDISFAVAKGSVHGVIGENGAGKSTLMSIVYGYYQADSGQILVDGDERRIDSPQAAIGAGIGMVHQHFMLVDTFTVLENVVLGVEGGRLLAAGLAQARDKLTRLAREYELEVDLDAKVGELPVGLQQRVEILKALYRGAEILILDEPTGVLTPQQADHLFRILRTLRDQGKTVILITHKLREIMAITDRVTVMRRGHVVGDVATATTNPQQLAELMVGRSVLLKVTKTPARPGAELLRAEGLRLVDGKGVARLRDVSFALRAGEIVGIAGVSGNGQSELLEVLAGIRPLSDGRLIYKGMDISSAGRRQTPKSMRRLRLGHVPEDRHRMGLITAFQAYDSSILGYHDDKEINGQILLRMGAVVSLCDRLMAEFDVRPADSRLRTAHFSGGNQQKIVLAREMQHDPDVLLVGQPTRGVDIGAIEFIHRRLIELRDRGKAILLVSVELDEILALSDRILVMFEGGIVGEVPAESATEQQLGLMMAGVAPAAP
ncbi:MAG: ABC transporter ATP-binding protein [Proteobacteria bacterium]|nr:ABC transporter ATP-binding protein [Pseudomonadota bacterium]